MHEKSLLISFHNFNIKTTGNLGSNAFTDVFGKRILALTDMVHLRPDECVTSSPSG
jgi:hypothetical protein